MFSLLPFWYGCRFRGDHGNDDDTMLHFMMAQMAIEELYI